MMKRLAALLVLLALVVAIAPTPTLAQNLSFSVGVAGDNEEFLTSNVTCRVMTAGSNTDATIYSDPQLSTAASNPLTADGNGACKWYGSATSYDVLVLANGGNYKGSRARVQGLTQTGAKLVYLQRNVAERILMVPFTRTVGINTPTTSALTIPAGALIKEVIVETKQAVASSSVNVGIGTSTILGAVNTSNLCSGAATVTAGAFANCAPSSLLLAASTAINQSSQDHDASGYIWVKYIETSVGP